MREAAHRLRLLGALPVTLRADAGGTADAALDHLAAEAVCTLRAWFDGPGGEPPARWAAQRDPVVGAALAKRFADLVGEPPLTWAAPTRSGSARRSHGSEASTRASSDASENLDTSETPDT